MANEISDRDSILLREGMNHSWNWFALHAGQRMQAVNFFLVTIGFLTSAYSFALNADRPEVAAVIGLIGGLVTFYFRRLEVRTKELVKAGEAALKASEAILAKHSGTDSFEIASIVEEPGERFSSYGQVIFALQATVFLAFVSGLIYAVVEAA